MEIPDDLETSKFLGQKLANLEQVLCVCMRVCMCVYTCVYVCVCVCVFVCVHARVHIPLYVPTYVKAVTNPPKVRNLQMFTNLQRVNYPSEAS